MEKNVKILTYGSISKEETLKTVVHNVVQNTFVLEINEPFSGYHGDNLPTKSVPRSLFFVLAKKIIPEEIFRVSQKIQKYFTPSFDASPAELQIYNSTYHSIRIWGVTSFESIPDLQESFMNEGVKFAKMKKLEARSLIKIQKLFTLTDIGNSIYKDLEDEGMFYIRIPTHLSWGLFETITKRVKNNVDINNFDAALGTLYTEKLVDVIRIFCRGYNEEMLVQIKTKYFDGIYEFRE